MLLTTGGVVGRPKGDFYNPWTGPQAAELPPLPRMGDNADSTEVILLPCAARSHHVPI
jgi:hypothetical protein